MVPRRNVIDRDSLVQIAADLVGAGGIEATHIADVAVAAGVSVGTVYNHFSSKDNLLDAVTSRIEETVVVVMAAAAPPAVPLRGAVPDLVAALLSMTAHSPALRVLSERANTGDATGTQAPLVHRWIVERVTMAQRAGEVAAVDAGIVADLGFALIQAAMTRMTTEPTPDEEDGQLSSLAVAGLLGLLPPR